MKPMIYVQIIRTHWTKRSRGAPAATSRACVPLVLPVDVAALRRGQFAVAIYSFGESDFSRPFDSKMETLELTNNLRYERGAFTLNWNGQNATTNWHWSAWNVGAPQPKFLVPRAGRMEVALDNWVRLRWHGRFSDQDTGKWWYEQTVVNVARCDENLNVDFSGEPSRVFAWLPQLR